MAESAARGAGRRRRAAWAAVVVVALAAGGAAAYRLDAAGRLGEVTGVGGGDPTTAPVAPPPGLDLPSPPAAPAVGQPVDPRPGSPAAVRRALGRLPHARRLGPRVDVAVSDLRTGRPLYRAGPPVSTPASTMKLLTCTAVLEALGPEHRFTTSVVRSGRQVVLVGGGDPLLAAGPSRAGDYPRQADLTTLARRTATALRQAGLTKVHLSYDTSLFSGPRVDPTWRADYVPDDVVSPITSLWTEEGRERAGLAPRAADPALAAARTFAARLRDDGVRSTGGLADRPAPAHARVVSLVQSAPLSQLVQHTLETSDNEAAEVLARHVAIAEGEPASFAGGARAVVGVVRSLGVPLGRAVVTDGSGLSRQDRVQSDTLIAVLSAAAARPHLRTVVTGLPVAGFSGSLVARFEEAPEVARGEVRAKTGTLTGVHALAGTVTTRDGALLAFVAIADRVDPVHTLFARDQLDRISAALAGCRCGR